MPNRNSWKMCEMQYNFYVRNSNIAMLRTYYGCYGVTSHARTCIFWRHQFGGVEFNFASKNKTSFEDIQDYFLQI